MAIASFVDRPGLRSDDRFLREALERIGIEVVPTIWDDESVEWDSFDGCVIRSVSDYHLKYDAFLAWLDRVGGLVPTWNPVDLIAWNADKRHLRELSEQGVPIVPTHWVARGSSERLADILTAHGWDEVVIKPTVGLAAQMLHRVRGSEDGGQLALTELLSDRGAMVQPFLPSIKSHGETSLIYIEGEMTHAVRKRPAADDFRVQGVWGGTSEPCRPSDAEMSVASDVLALVSGDPLFARVDLVEGPEGGPCLIELETIEPDLFFREKPGAANRLAQAIAGRLRQ